MGTALITIKLMPSSPEVDLEELKKNAQETLEGKEGVKNIRFEEEDVAFGLKAVKVSFDIPEDQGLDPIEEALSSLESVNSAQVVDMRRALE